MKLPLGIRGRGFGAYYLGDLAGPGWISACLHLSTREQEKPPGVKWSLRENAGGAMDEAHGALLNRQPPRRRWPPSQARKHAPKCKRGSSNEEPLWADGPEAAWR